VIATVGSPAAGPIPSALAAALAGQGEDRAGTLVAGDVIEGPTKRYVVVAPVGQGSFGVTYKCTEEGTGRVVAVKAVAVRKSGGWKAFELFEREAKLLQNLPAHDGVPRFYESFECGEGGELTCYLVQELVPGRTLAAHVRDGSRPDEQEVRRILIQLLETVRFLGSLNPPVVHRDIKPENVVVAGDRTVLIDFGAVQDALKTPGLGTTVVGTYGYMSPEQYRGAAGPKSDLFAVGGVALFLLSGKSPDQFPQKRLAVDFEGGVSASEPLIYVIKGLLEPLQEDRLTAGEALAYLSGERPNIVSPGTPVTAPGTVGGRAFDRRRGTGASSLAIQDALPPLGRAEPPVLFKRGAGTVKRPKGTRVVVERTPGRLVIIAPPGGLNAGSASIGFFAIFWNAFVAVWTAGALAGGGLLFAAFSIPFWGAGAVLAKQAADGAFLAQKLELGRKYWSLAQKRVVRKGPEDVAESYLLEGGELTGGETEDLRCDLVTTGSVNGVPTYAIVLGEGTQEVQFGAALRDVELAYILSEIRGFLEGPGDGASAS